MVFDKFLSGSDSVWDVVDNLIKKEMPKIMNNSDDAYLKET